MNKILKRLLVCTLALLMVVNPLGACFATGAASGGVGGGALSDVTVTVVEADGEYSTDNLSGVDYVKNLTFIVNVPETLGEFSSAIINFSYDNTVIQPMMASPKKATTEDKLPVEIGRSAFSADDMGAAPMITTATVGNRTGVSIVAGDGEKYDASSGLYVTSFWFKYIDESKANSETFLIEKDNSAGSVLSALYSDPSEQIGMVIAVKDASDVTTNFNYTNDASNQIAAPVLTYTGSDKLVLGRIAIDEVTDVITIPTVYPAAADAKFSFVAKAWSTIETEMDMPADATWALVDESGAAKAYTGVTIDTATGELTVKSNAVDDEIVRVKLTAGGKEADGKVMLNRDADADDYIVTTVDGEELTTDAISVIAPVKDSETNTYVFKTTGLNAYGEELGETYTYAVTGTESSLISISEGTLTVSKGAEEIKGAAVTVSDSTGVIKTVALNISSLVVDWADVVAVTGKTYGAKNSELVEIPSAGTATVGSATINGKFEVVDADAVQGANTEEGVERTVTVKFTVTDEGDYKGIEITKNIAVEIGKAKFDLSAFEATLEDLTAEFTGEAVEYTFDDANIPAGLRVSVGYILANAVSSVIAPPVSVGAHKAVIKYTLTGDAPFVPANYEIPADVTKNLTITKATLKKIGEVKDVEKTAYEVKDVTEAAAFVNYLPATVDAYYTAEKAETVEVEWKTTDSYDAKGKTYTFTGTLKAGELVECEGETVTAKVIVAPSAVTATAVLGTSTLAKKSIADAVTFIDINEGIKIEFAEWTEAKYVTADELTFDKTLEAVKAEAAAIAEEGTIKIKATELPAEYAWATVTLPEFTINVTAKYVATVTATLSADSVVYGEALPTVEAKAEAIGGSADGSVIADAKFNYVYYNEAGAKLTEAPKDAGKYTVVAVLDNEEYAGTSENKAFEIKAKEVTYEIENITKTYGDAWPTPAGALAEGSALVGDDDLGVKLNAITLDKLTDAGTTGLKVSAEWTNKNYAVTFTGGEITITKKDISTMKAPEITGVAEVNKLLYAEIFEGAEIDPEVDTEVGRIWYVKDGDTWKAINDDATWFNYLVDALYSNKEIAVTAKALPAAVNYTGETEKSAAVKVAKYTLDGTVTIALTTDNGEAGVIEAGDTVTATVDGDEITETVLASIKYEWTIGGEKVEGVDTASLEIPAGKTGEVKVKAYLPEGEGDYLLNIEPATAGEIGKKQLDVTVEATIEADVITAAVSGGTATEEDYEIKWFRGTTEFTATSPYTVTEADLGQTITVKAIAKGEVFTGEVAKTVKVPAKAPSDVKIETSATGTTITVTVTAKENGAEIIEVAVNLAAEDGTPIEAAIAEEKDGKFTYTFEGLEAGKTYKVEAFASNIVGISDNATAEVVTTTGIVNTGGNKKPSSSKPSGTTTPTTPSTPSAPTEVVVESSKPSATVDSKALEGKETVSATVKTEEGTEVKMEADIKDANVANLTVEATKAEVEVSEDVKETVVEVIEVKVEATDASKNEVDVKVDVTIPSEEKAYAYEVDAFGNLVRTESEYDAEAGEVKVSGVADGTVLAVSTTEPKAFADTQGRWSEAEINKAADRGIVNGKGDGFDPAGNLTRHESNVLYMNLVDAVKATLEKKADAKVDTHEEHWGYDSDVWAVEVGISTGVGVNAEGEVIMNGAANITRQDFATLAARVLGLVVGEIKVEGEAKAFVDGAELPEYAKAAVDMLSGLGIINGSEVNGGFKFSGAANITREEAAAITNRIYEFVASVLVK